MEFTGSVSGIYNLDKVFSNLPGTTRRKAMMPALKAGAKVIRDKTEENLRNVTSGDSTGILANNIRVYSLKKLKGNLRVAVQVKRGLHNQYKLVNGKPVRVGLYAGVLEYREGGKYSSWRKAIREGNSQAISEITSIANKNMVAAVNEAIR